MRVVLSVCANCILYSVTHTLDFNEQIIRINWKRL